MIARLCGVPVEQLDDGTLTLDVAGVGYEVSLPLGSLGRARREPDGRVVVHVHTVVREDAFLLYGFATPEDREVFRLLIGIASVGPKTAIGILGALRVDELREAVATKAVVRLTSISGVGKKTAERLILELKDKIGPSSSPLPGVAAAPANRSKQELLRGALTNLGFRPHEVERAVEAMRDRLEVDGLPELIRDSLAHAASPA